MDGEADADDEYEDIEEDDAKEESGSDAGSVSSSASGAKRRKREKGHDLATKSLRNTGRRAKRARPLAADQTMQAVGQVLRLNPDGTIIVNWCDGSSTSSYPQDLYIVWDMSDYSNSDNWESVESLTSEETDSISWETEEEEEMKGVGDGDGDGDDIASAEEEPSALKDMNETRRRTIKELLQQAQTYFNQLADLYAAHHVTRSSNADISSLSHTSLLKCMNGILKIYKSCRKLDKVLKTYYFSVPEVLSLVSAIKYDIKKEKSNKIKQHLDHVFESSNKGLLDGEKVATGAAATALSGMGDVQTGAEKPADADSMPQRMEDNAEEDGTPVDGVAGACSAKEDGELWGVTRIVNLVSSGVDAGGYYSSGADKIMAITSLREIERDISSMLAAANVAEDKVTSAESLPNGKIQVDKGGLPNGESGVDGEELKSPEACACPEEEMIEKLKRKAEDLEKSKDCLETVHNISHLCMTLCKSLQETIDTVYAAMELGDGGMNATSSTDKAPEPNEKVETQTDMPLSETLGSACPVRRMEEKTADPGDSVPEAQDVANLRADSQEAYSTSNSSNTSETANQPCASEECGKEEEEDIEVDELPAGAPLRGFQICGEAPPSHRFFHHMCHPSNPRSFNAAVKKELKLLKSSLPEGIIVKGYEDRMDLFSVLIEGPASTPYEDGVFIFDVMLPHDYPANPPHFKYLSFCHDRLNPNLYADGKVCVSLLGTWAGKGMEVWTDKSNLLQVLVSIQGLILVDEPYYNEAGYERQRAVMAVKLLPLLYKTLTSAA
nr:hypothetical protein BaRGS_017121 [Batillaria attramentaria]